MNAVVSMEVLISEKFKWQGARFIPALLVLSIGCFVWMIPVPEGLEPKAWHLLAIFVATIVGLIVKPLPMGSIAILAIATATITETLSIEQACSGFGLSIVWLMVSAFLLAQGFFKTGLSSRIAYYFISILGKSTLGLTYGLILTDLFLAPFMPSNTARGAGILYPIIASLNKEYNSSPEQGTARKIGAFLIQAIFHANIITSAMFMTATAANPLIVNFAADSNVSLTWASWAIAYIPLGIISLFLLPLLLYKFYPPEIKNTPEAPLLAKQKLQDLGPIKVEEKLMLATFALLLFLWIFGYKMGINPTTSAIIGLSVLLFTGILNWNDIIKAHNAWDTFIWMATLIMLSTQLGGSGIIAWALNKMQGVIANVNGIMAILLVIAVYNYSHYLFASITAHITALFATSLVFAIAAGIPPMLATLLLAAISNLCAGVTHYGTGPAPVYFGANYVNIKDWWRLGAIVNTFNLVIWVGLGMVWWKILGYI